MKPTAVGLILLFVLLAASTVPAYEYTQCGSVDCFWPGFPVGFYLGTSIDALFPDAGLVARDAVQRWNDNQQTFCGIFFKFLGSTRKAVSAMDQDNIVFAKTSDWPYGAETLAVTQCYYKTNGQFVDCDIAVNAQDWKWSDTPSGGALNLRDTITHEAGHFWGLNHSDIHTATMYAYYDAKMVASDLDEDDILGAYDRFCSESLPADDGLEPNDSIYLWQESLAEGVYEDLRLYDIDHFRIAVVEGEFPKIEIRDDEPDRHKIVSLYDITGTVLGTAPCDGDCVVAPYRSPVEGSAASILVETDFSRSTISAETYSIDITQVTDVSDEDLTDDEIPAGDDDDDEDSGCGC